MFRCPRDLNPNYRPQTILSNTRVTTLILLESIGIERVEMLDGCGSNAEIIIIILNEMYVTVCTPKAYYTPLSFCYQIQLKKK